MTQIQQPSWRQARETVRERDGKSCLFCGMENDEHMDRFSFGLEVHHIVPRRFGGTNHPDNLITVCKRCHRVAERISRRATLYGTQQHFGGISEYDGRYCDPERESISYTFECPDDVWYEWADSIPRSQNLDDRLIELIEEDKGR